LDSDGPVSKSGCYSQILATVTKFRPVSLESRRTVLDSGEIGQNPAGWLQNMSSVAKYFTIKSILRRNKRNIKTYLKLR